MRETAADLRREFDHSFSELPARIAETESLLARRAGDRSAARRELELALSLLEREDASRLLLFGGGFQREALLALCRAELAAAGGAR